MKNFRLIPLLVFVALLSFSVRIAEVVYGVSHRGGEAQAAAESHEPPPATPPAGGLMFEEEKPAASEAATAAEPEGVAEKDKVEWRDPGDEDPNYQAVRDEIYDDLAKRRADLEKRERELMTREALLKAGEQELDRKYQELTQLRSELEKLLQKQSDEENARVTSLVKIYEGMKPKDAARIFDTLDLDILVTVMGKMSERKLSPILAEMNSERARTITIMLAEQKSLPELPGSN